MCLVTTFGVGFLHISRVLGKVLLVCLDNYYALVPASAPGMA
jgi:hypothetical protein